MIDRPVRALLVDDERLARAELRRLLADHPEVEVAGEAATVAEARAACARLAPDVIFLDVQLPDGSGFDLLEALEDLPLVVFSTAWDRHAVRAFEVSALDYLVKPVERERLAAAVARVGAALAARGASGPAGPLERVFVREGARCWLVALADVPLLSAEGNFARLHLGGAEPLLSRSLQYLEARLDPRRWFRASRQHLVNVDRIVRIGQALDGRLVVELQGGHVVEMSRRQSQRFRERMSP